MLLEALERRVLLSTSIYDPKNLPLDPSFGNAGILTGYSGPMIVQSDGKILVDQNGTGQIVRLSPDGSPDQTFNPAGAIDDWGPDYAAQSDGKYLILKDSVLTRYNANGSVDTSFGTGGSVSSFYVNPTYMSFTPQAITMQGDKVVVAGQATLGPHVEWTIPGRGPYAIERLNPDGTQDTGFGMHICIASDADPVTVRRVRISPNGHILVAGDDTEWQFGIADFAGDGPDGSKGVFHHLNEGGPLVDMVFAPDGKIVTVGEAGAAFNHAWIARLNPDFTFDDSFRTWDYGSYITAAGVAGDFDASSKATGVAVAPNGDVLVSFNDYKDPTIIRLLSTGMHTGGWIACTGFEDTNGNGVLDPGEQDGGGGDVYLDLNNNGQLDPGEPYAPGGTFVNLLPGTYRVRQALPYGYRQTVPADGYYDVTVADGQTVNSGLVFAAQNVLTEIEGQVQTEYASELTFTVYADANGNGQLDPGEISAKAYTGADHWGYWYMELAPGNYTIRVQPNPGYLQKSPTNDGGYSVTLPMPKVERGNDRLPGTFGNDFVFGAISPTTTSIINGRVFVDSNRNRWHDPGETGVPGAVVFFDQNENGQPDLGEPSAVTGTDGTYTLRIDATPSTERKVVVQLPAGYQLLDPTLTGTPVDVGGGAGYNGVDFSTVLAAPAPPPPDPSTQPPASGSPPPDPSAQQPASDPAQAVATDRIALKTARSSYAQSLVGQTRQIQTDRRALAVALRTLRQAQVRARHTGGTVDPAPQEDVDRLRAALLADEQSLKTLHQAGLAQINAARSKLLASQRAARAARHR